jgi:hypothetical protein
MIWLRMLMGAAEALGLALLGLVLAAWLLGDLAATATRIVDSFFIPTAQRMGDLGAAWQRLLVAVRAAWTRWRTAKSDLKS